MPVAHPAPLSQPRGALRAASRVPPGPGTPPGQAVAGPGHGSPAKELQQLPPVPADLLAPGVGPSGAGQERPPAQLLLEEGPQGGLGTQHLDATHTGVNATLGTAGPSAPGPHGPPRRPWQARPRRPPDLLAPLHPDLHDGPEAAHVLQQDHSAVRRHDAHLHGGTEPSAPRAARERLPPLPPCPGHLPGPPCGAAPPRAPAGSSRGLTAFSSVLTVAGLSPPSTATRDGM